MLLEVGVHSLDEAVVGVEHEGVSIGHLPIEAHTLLQTRHLLVAAHVFALGDDYGAAVFAHGGSLDVEFRLLHLGHYGLEYGGEVVLGFGIHLLLSGIVLLDEVVDGVAVYTEEAYVLVAAFRLFAFFFVVGVFVGAPFLFECADKGSIELAVEEEHVVAFCACCLDVAPLCLAVVAVEAYEVTVLVGLVFLDGSLVFLVGVAFAVDVAEQGKLFGLVVEVGLAEDTVVDEEFEVVPLLLEVFAVLAEDGLQAVSHLLGDVLRNLLDVAVALQVGAADVEGNVRTVDDAVEQGKEVRDNVLHAVGDEHLVAEELDLVAVNVDVALDFREVEHTGEVEGVVDIQMNPEEGIVLHGIEVAVEGLVILVLQCRGLFGPEGLGDVDDVRFVGLLLAAVLPFGLLAEGDGYGEELAVLLQQFFDAVFLEELLAVVVNMEHDVRTALCLVGLFEGEFGVAVAAPLVCRFVLPTLGDNVDTLRYHEGAVESESEVSDDGGGIVLVFLQEVGGSAEGNLVDVAVNLFGGHTDTAVADGEGAGFGVNLHFDGEVLCVAHVFAFGGEGLQFLRGVDGVGHNLTQEDFVVAIEEFLDDGEDVLGGDTDVSFLLCHNIIYEFFVFCAPSLQCLCQSAEV